MHDFYMLCYTYVCSAGGNDEWRMVLIRLLFSLLCYIDVNWDWRRCSVSFYYMLLRLFIACFILFGYKWKFSYYLISISRLIKLFSRHLARVFLPRSLSLNQILILLGELSIRSLMRPLLAKMSHMPHFK